MNTSTLTHQEIIDIGILFDFLEKDQMYGEMGLSAIAAIRRELPELLPATPEASVVMLRKALLSILSGVGPNVAEDRVLHREDIQIAYEALQRTNHLQVESFIMVPNKTTLKA